MKARNQLGRRGALSGDPRLFDLCTPYASGVDALDSAVSRH